MKIEETEYTPYTAKLGTKFETVEDDAEDLLYISTDYGYGFAIPLVDFNEYVEHLRKES